MRKDTSIIDTDIERLIKTGGTRMRKDKVSNELYELCGNASFKGMLDQYARDALDAVHLLIEGMESIQIAMYGRADWENYGKAHEYMSDLQEVAKVLARATEGGNGDIDRMIEDIRSKYIYEYE